MVYNLKDGDIGKSFLNIKKMFFYFLDVIFF